MPRVGCDGSTGGMPGGTESLGGVRARDVCVHSYYVLAAASLTPELLLTKFSSGSSCTAYVLSAFAVCAVLICTDRECGFVGQILDAPSAGEDEPQMGRVDADALKHFVSALLRGQGSDAAEAETVADHLVPTPTTHFLDHD